MHFDYILFDLDGTLTDPGIGITNSVMFALKKYGIQAKDRSELYQFIGPPLVDSFKKFYGFSDDEAYQAVEFYREYFRDKGIFENRIYDGITDLLEQLRKNNKTLILATSKPWVYAKQILDHFNIAKYFTFTAGSNLDGTRTKKHEVIQYALESCSITDKSKAIMVGDREHDILGAKKVGIQSIGVLFGYGGREELESAGANYIAGSVGEIGRLVMQV